MLHVIKDANNDNNNIVNPVAGKPLVKQYTATANTAVVIDVEYTRNAGVILCDILS